MKIIQSRNKREGRYIGCRDHVHYRDIFASHAREVHGLYSHSSMKNNRKQRKHVARNTLTEFDTHYIPF